MFVEGRVLMRLSKPDCELVTLVWLYQLWWRRGKMNDEPERRGRKKRPETRPVVCNKRRRKAKGKSSVGKKET